MNTIDYKGFIIELIQDNCPESPCGDSFEFVNGTHMVIGEILIIDCAKTKNEIPSCTEELISFDDIFEQEECEIAIKLGVLIVSILCSELNYDYNIAKINIHSCVNCLCRKECDLIKKYRLDNKDYWEERKTYYSFFKNHIVLQINSDRYLYTTSEFDIEYFVDKDTNFEKNYISIPKKEAKKEGINTIEYLKSIVKIYSAWAFGDVWGFRVLEEDEYGDEIQHESCYGFYGYNENEELMIKDAKDIIDSIIEERKKAA